MNRTDSFTDHNTFVDKFSDVSMSMSSSNVERLSRAKESRKVHQDQDRYSSDECGSPSISPYMSAYRSSYTSTCRPERDRRSCSKSSQYTTSSSSTLSSRSSRKSINYYRDSSSSSGSDCERFKSRGHGNRRQATRHHKTTEKKSFFRRHDDVGSKYRSRRPASPRDDDSLTSMSSNSSLSSSSSSLRDYSPPRHSLGVLPMAYWERSAGCREAKLNHMERMDHFCDDDREYLILQTTLWNRFHTLERNMFPYDTPDGVEHWTLWCREEMTHKEVCDYVSRWLRKHMPHVRRWNYDDNSGDRSIDLFHVHVYIETRPSANLSKDSPQPI